MWPFKLKNKECPEKISQGVANIINSLLSRPTTWVQGDHVLRHIGDPKFGIWTGTGGPYPFEPENIPIPCSDRLALSGAIKEWRELKLAAITDGL